MNSYAVPIGTFFLLICTVLQVVGIATNYWMQVSVLSGTHAGLFKLCVKKYCTSYFALTDSFSFHVIGILVCSGIACVLLVAACLIGFCGCRTPNQKPTVTKIGVVGLFGGLFSAAGVLWYFLYYFRGIFGDLTAVLATFGVDYGPGWSFFLCSAAAGMSTVLSIILQIVGCNMVSHTSSVAPVQQPVNDIPMTGGQYPGHHQPSAFAMHNSAYNDPYARSRNYYYDYQKRNY